jgi:hypothetical protein
MYKLYDSTRVDKKFMIITPSGKKVHFGAVGYEDFTMHKDVQRKERYISRHQSRENWTLTGADTAGFWSRWLLWNKPTIIDSIDDIHNRFGIIIEFDVHHER